jgi:predicted nucleic acid-binding protein
VKKIFVDTDIILDLLGKREPFFKYASELFSIVECGKIKAYTSPVIFANLYYILCKQIGKEQALKNLQKIKLIIKILPVDERIVELALNSGFTDFEDAIQYYAARSHGINCLLTRNKKDFKKSDITIMSAEEFLYIFERSSTHQ